MQTKLPPPERADWILGLLERHERALVAFATRRLGGDRERARDAVQETFLRLCRAERAQVEGRAAEWLHTVCRNLLHDWCRKEGKMKAQSEDEGETALIERAADVADGPAEEIEREETRSVLLAGLERLPARQKEALRLKFQAGLGYAEIAGVMETSIGNVGYLIHVGLKNLRERLAPRAHDLGALQG